jgi:hypothetical protein
MTIKLNKKILIKDINAFHNQTHNIYGPYQLKETVPEPMARIQSNSFVYFYGRPTRTNELDDKKKILIHGWHIMEDRESLEFIGGTLEEFVQIKKVANVLNLLGYVLSGDYTFSPNNSSHILVTLNIVDKFILISTMRFSFSKRSSKLISFDKSPINLLMPDLSKDEIDEKDLLFLIDQTNILLNKEFCVNCQCNAESPCVQYESECCYCNDTRTPYEKNIINHQGIFYDLNTRCELPEDLTYCVGCKKTCFDPEYFLKNYF